MKRHGDDDTVDDLVADDPVAETAERLFGPTPAPVRVSFGAASHIGHVRSTNEDHFVVVRRRRSRDVLHTNLPQGCLPTGAHDDAYTMVVADGVGGSAFGELASMLALREAWDLTTHAFKWHFQITDREAEELEQTVNVYGQLVHRRLQQQAEADPRLRGMGTTLTGALTAGLDAFFFHAGDSRAYLYRSGTLQRLTRDHTLAQQLVEAGALTSLSQASRVMRNMLVNCLGGRHKHVEVDTYRLRLCYGDRLIICTDGLTDMVRESEIAHEMRQHDDPQDACQTLLDQALHHGGKDNVTIVIARYEDESDKKAAI
jgi:protein phosphatase